MSGKSSSLFKHIIDDIARKVECCISSKEEDEPFVTLGPTTARVMIQGIREMQEEIKLRTRAGRELEDQLRGDRQTMDAAIAAIDDGVIGSARMLLVMAHPAKHQPKDNGAGGKR